MSVRLDLKAGVINPVELAQPSVSLIEHRVHGNATARHQVDGGDVHLRGESPHVEVMNVDDAVDPAKVRPETLHIPVVGRRLHQHPQSSAPKLPAQGARVPRC